MFRHAVSKWFLLISKTKTLFPVDFPVAETSIFKINLFNKQFSACFEPMEYRNIDPI